MVDFTKTYIDECIKQNKSSLVDIIVMAKGEIKEIDEEIKQLEGRRNRQINLRTFLRQVGAIGGKTSPAVVMESISVTESDNPYIKSLAVRICDFLQTRESITTRDILDEINNPAENKAALLAIKYLWDAKVIFRDDIKRNITKGDKWDQRPRGE